MVDVKCNICGCSEKGLLFKTRDYNWSGRGPFDIVKCAKCTLVYLTPRPDNKELGRFYPDVYYDNVKGGFGLRHKMKIVGRNIKPGRVLDIGCGKAFFLNRMKALGWAVTGVELSAKEANFAREHFGIEVYTKEITELSLQKNCFDLVTCWHSLEHTKDPALTLSRIREFLKKDGRLIISTPNISSLQAKLFGGKWYHMDAPRHFHLFSAGTIKLLLGKCSFSIKKRYGFAFRHSLFGWGMSLSNALNLNRAPIRLLSKLIRLLLFILATPVAFIESLFPFSSTLEVSATKEEK